MNYFEYSGRVTVKNEVENKEEVLKFLKTASIHLEDVWKAAKVLIQNQIFGRAKCEAENLTAQLLRSVKPIFIFTSYVCKGKDKIMPLQVRCGPEGG